MKYTKGDKPPLYKTLKMATYKITGQTNGYIANRDIHFNGKTQITLATGLTEDQAKEKLEEFFNSDYPNANYYSFLSEFIYDIFYPQIEEQAWACEMNIDEYYELTKKRWEIYYDNKIDTHLKFQGPGYYSISDHCGVIFEKGAFAYEYDSRSYGIHEEYEEA